MKPQEQAARAAIIAGRIKPRHDAFVVDVVGLHGNYVVTIVGDDRYCSCPFGRKMEDPQQKQTCWHIPAALGVLTTETPTITGDPFQGLGG